MKKKRATKKPVNKPKQLKLQLDLCWIDQVKIGFGQVMYVCYARESIAPVGMVWGFGCTDRNDRSRFDVLGSFVVPFARRQGVRTLINNHIINEDGYHVITSTGGTKEEGGEAFMRAYGYEHDEQRLTWTYVKRQD